MKRLVLLLSVLSLTIIQCGGSQQSTYQSTNIKKKGINDDEPETYTGNVEKIRFFDGGWYGLYPNYNVDLILQVNDNGLIAAVLDTPECQLEASVPAKAFQLLIDLVNNGERKAIPSPLTTTIDQGTKAISLTTTDEASGKGKEEITHLDYAYPQFTDAAADDIQDAVDAIVEQLIKTNGCNTASITSLKIDQRLYDSELGGPIRTPTEMVANVLRKFTITKSSGQYWLSGREERNHRFGGCTRVLDKVILAPSLVASMNKIEIRKNELVCLAQPMGDTGLDMVINYGQTVKEGSAGCWNSSQVLHHDDFMKSIIQLIEKQEASCWEY